MTAPRPTLHPSGGSSGGKFPRDAWLLGALEREGALSAKAVEQVRQAGGEWVAATVIEQGMTTAELVERTAARVAHVPVASLAQVEPAAVQFVPENVARQYAALPLSATNRVIRIATANPMDLDAEQALGFVAGRQVEFLYALPTELLERLNEIYRPERSIERLVDGLDTEPAIEHAAEAKAPPPSGVEAPAARLVDATIADAVRERASDIRLEPSEEGLLIRYRIDGVLKEVMKVPRTAAGSVVRRLKVIAKLDIADPLHPHEGRATVRVDGKAWELRVATAPVGRLGESVLLRLHDPAAPIASFGELGLWPDERALFEQLVSSRDGVLLIAGATDGGTTASAYAAFLRAHARAGNVATVEGPIEHPLQGVTQIEVSETTGFTFAQGLQSALRQNPEVVLLGEIRDPETAALAWQSARAGRMIISVVRARDAAGAVVRLRELGLEPAAIAATLRGVVGQALLRRLCVRCAEPADAAILPPPMRPPATFGAPVAIRAAKGCPQCGFTGYRGRSAVIEALTVDGRVSQLIASGAGADALAEAGRNYGMRSLWQASLRRVWTGETSYDELVRVLGEPPALQAATRPAAQPAAPAAPGGRPVAAPTRRPTVAPPATPPTSPTPPQPSPAARVSPPTRPSGPTAVPAAASAPAPPPAAPGAGADAGPAPRPLVLIADDDPAMRVLAATIMKAQGFDVAEAGDGLEALAQAQRLAPAVMLLDMEMPRIDGFGVLEALRRRLAGRAVPVVVVTARDDPATEARCIELGAEDYLTKPIQPSSLVVRVRAVLRRVGANYTWPKS